MLRMLGGDRIRHRLCGLNRLCGTARVPAMRSSSVTDALRLCGPRRFSGPARALTFRAADSRAGTPPSTPTPRAPHTDMRADSWVRRLLPARVIPFAELARWDRPIGTWLLLWPGLWSIALAAPAGALPDTTLCAVFAAGSVLMRGAGCIVNDMWDRDIDRRVERTRTRPLASGAVSMPHALLFLSAHLGISLSLLLTLPLPAVVAGLASTPVWALYPLAKRVTDWPQAVLGLAYNWGALLGWVAVHGEPHWPVVAPLYAGCALWTLNYDTVYAYQDAADDATTGVRSSALALGDGVRARAFLGVMSAGCVGGLAIAAANAGVHPACFAGIGAAGAHLAWQVRWDCTPHAPLSDSRRHPRYSNRRSVQVLRSAAWQVRTVDLADRADCLRKFQSNRDFGALVLAAIVAGKWFAPPGV